MPSVPVSRYLAFFLIAGGGCALDLWTKWWIFSRLGMPDHERPVWWIIEGWFGFQTSLNQGALFGMGQGMVMYFAAASVAAGLAILYWLFIAGAARDWWLTVALSLVTAGVLGNLYDRLGLWSPAEARIHAVRDWILLQYGEWVWPNFNIADSALVCGAALLMIHACWPAKASPADDA